MSAEEVVLYWRPGCGFCHALRRQLDRAGVERIEVNIWEDPAAAAVVRSHARGNETVPTVVVGNLGMVNPTADEVIAAIRSSGTAGAEPLDHPARTLGAADRMKRSAPNPWRGAVWAVAAAGLWVLLALINPTTTYHFAPLLAVLAWPIAARFGEPHRSWRSGLVAAVVSTAIAVAATVGLAALDALRGPALVGGSAFAESLLMVAAGLIVAAASARPRRHDAGPLAEPRTVVGSGGGCTTLPDGTEQCQL